MSFGKLYSYAGNPRTTALQAVAKANNLDIELVQTEPAKGVDTEYLKLNKLGKVPTFEGADGFVVTECIAIAIYLTSQNEKTTLLGKTKQDYASILRWMSFANAEVLPSLAGWFRPLIGRDPYHKKNVEDSEKATRKVVKVLEDHLLVNTYLVGERLTLADLFVTALISRGFEFFFDKAFRSEHPNVSRWFETIYNQSIYSEAAQPMKLAETAMPNQPPKKEEKPKEEKPKAAKAEKKPAAKEVEEEEEEAPAPKPKHPLEQLERASFPLDEWKRQYSNNEYNVSFPWFWDNAKFDEYSIYKVDYKYPEELPAMTFMSSNLITGFFTRLEASRKYLFGAASVYTGEESKSYIRGAFVVRGQEALPAFDVAPDYESYEFTKLDPTKAEDKKFVESMWGDGEAIDVEGKKYEYADGKIFK